MKSRLRLEALEARETPATTVADPANAFAWVLVNEMRQDPAGFAGKLDGLRRGTVDSAFGFSKSDPVVGDLRRLLTYASYPGHYQQAIQMLRSTQPMGPLGWDDVLYDRAARHVEWMRTHSFEHTAEDHPYKRYIPDFHTAYRGGDPDTWGYDPGRYYWWGEDIAYTYGLMAHSKAAYAAHRFGETGFQERAAFIDTISLVLESNSPDMAHLEQLLRPDAAPDGGTPHFNAIGMDVEYYEGPYEAHDHFGEATLSTHRLGLYRPGGSGGFLTGVAFRDGNGNSFFDAGEGIAATITVTGPASFTDSLDRLTSEGVYSRYVPNGTYTVAGTAADGTFLGTATVTVNNSNAWFDLRDTRPASAAAPQLALAGPSQPVGMRPTVTWSAVSGAIGYEVQLLDASGGWSRLSPSGRITQISWSPPADLIPGQAYRVRVRAALTYADTAWATASFRVATPAVNIPATAQSLRPAVSWSAVPGASRYDVILSDLTTGNGNLFPGQQPSGTSWTPPADLVSGHSYAIRVRAVNDSGLGVWGATARFAVSVPKLLTPLGDASALRPTFTWSAIDGASTYAIVVDDLTAGRRSLFREAITSASWTPSTDLAPGHTYRWRVVAQNSAGMGRWSSPGAAHVVH